MPFSLFRRPRSLYGHVRAHVRPNRPGLTPGGEDLPDLEVSVDGLNWAPGAKDGVFGHHFGFGDDAADAVGELFEGISAMLDSRPTEAAYQRLYELMRKQPAIEVIDPLLRRIMAASLSHAGLRWLGLRLAHTGTDREPVKYGIALLGLSGLSPDRKLVRTLGRHEEFTLFAAVALSHIEADAETELWRLGQLVDGWGRIHVVERLKDTTRPEIREWILLEGFRNSIMDEYLAHIAASTGGLVDRLRQPDLDAPTMTAACDIVTALLNGGPAEDMADYADGPEAIRLLVGHLDRRGATLAHLLTADRIHTFLSTEQAGWDDAARAAVAERCAAITAREQWPPLVEAGLDADDPVTADAATRAARILGIDTFEAHWRRVRADPLSSAWHELLESVPDDRLDAVLEFAESSLPLADIASGPGTVLGTGLEYQANFALEFIVQGLARFPGRGWPLLAAALRSPVIRDRNTALGTLETWGADRWPAQARSAVEQARDAEPTDDVRARMAELLDNSSVD